MMRFGLFVAMAGRQSGGPETYEHCLLKALLEIDRSNEFHVFCHTTSARDSFGIRGENLKYHVLFPKNRWISTLTSYPLQVIKNRIDLLHATVVAPPYSPRDFVFTMHCFSSFARPDLYPLSVRTVLNRSLMTGIRHSKMILCVSQNVRDHVADTFKVPADRLRVVYNGVGEEFRPVPVEEARLILQRSYRLHEPYVLFVGQLKARKNIIRIVEAFGRLKHEVRSDLKLVLVGRRIWSSEGIDEAIDRLQLRNEILELGHLTLQDLPVLYSGAELLVFPSLWEGFGIPVIEAMVCGTPVVTSNSSCLPEIAGGCAVLVDPCSAEDIAAGMFAILSDPALRKELREKGLQRGRMFTWRRTAEQTLEAYRAVAS